MSQATVPCKWCAKPTHMLGTRECDGCHELVFRVRNDPALAQRVLNEMPSPVQVHAAITGDLPSTDSVYYMVAYGDLSSGFTFFGPFEEPQAEAYAATLPRNAEVYPLSEAVIFNQRHGYHPLTKRGYVVEPPHLDWTPEPGSPEEAAMGARGGADPSLIKAYDEAPENDAREPNVATGVPLRDEDTVRNISTLAIHLALGFYEPTQDIFDADVMAWASMARTTWDSLGDGVKDSLRQKHKEHLWAGANTQRHIGKAMWLSSDESDNLGGMVGASNMLAGVAIKLQNAYDRIMALFDSPEGTGVFDYDVVEAIGNRLRETGGQLDVGHAQQMFCEFFAASVKAPTVLCEVVTEVLS